eukprot:COSAG06_NODE_6881_length_2730_cov_12.025846_5_plen_96_part_00
MATPTTAVTTTWLIRSVPLRLYMFPPTASCGRLLGLSTCSVAWTDSRETLPRTDGRACSRATPGLRVIFGCSQASRLLQGRSAIFNTTLRRWCTK